MTFPDLESRAVALLVLYPILYIIFFLVTAHILFYICSTAIPRSHSVAQISKYLFHMPMVWVLEPLWITRAVFVPHFCHTCLSDQICRQAASCQEFIAGKTAQYINRRQCSIFGVILKRPILEGAEYPRFRFWLNSKQTFWATLSKRYAIFVQQCQLCWGCCVQTVYSSLWEHFQQCSRQVMTGAPKSLNLPLLAYLIIGA